MISDHDELDLSDWNSDFNSGDNVFDATIMGSNDVKIQNMNAVGDMDLESVTSQMGSSSKSVVIDVKKNVAPNITSIYEPKFYEIFMHYKQYAATYEPSIDNNDPKNQHLMVLCLNNMIPFSNWARDSANSSYIRKALFENQDMRPEVRNGLAMIIVYTFAAARAASENQSDPNSKTDMFSVLMKSETGLGIVNKTSLKIYSDPYGYFNFLKTCLSGLIDAQAIPENERQNIQISKKSRRGSKNIDEADAFNYIKSTLVSLFESPETLNLAREKIVQISKFWHLRGKSVRNDRFTSIMSLPQLNSEEDFPDPRRDNSFSSTPRNSGLSNPNRNSGRSNRTSGRSSNDSINIDFNQYRSQSHNVWNDNESVNSDSVSSSSRSPHPSFHENTNAMTNFTRSLGQFSTKDAEFKSNQYFEEKLNSIPIPFLRFDRIGATKWVANFMMVYDFDALLQSSLQSSVFLANEIKLKLFLNGLMTQQNQPPIRVSFEEGTIFNFMISPYMASTGLTNLENIVLKSGSLISSWNKLDSSQLKHFIESWRRAHFANISASEPSKQQTSQINTKATYLQSIPGRATDTNILANKDNIANNDIGRNFRRRTTGGLEMKKDLARLQQIQEFQLNNKINALGAGFSGWGINSGNNSPYNSAQSSPLWGEYDRKRIGQGDERVVKNDISLMYFWKMFNSNEKLMHLNQATTSPDPSLSDLDPKGLIVFERSLEVGLIVRANKELGIEEDLWCMYFPDDVLAILSSYCDPNSSVSFLDYLSSLLPQLRSLERFVKSGSNNENNSFAPAGSYSLPPNTQFSQNINQPSLIENRRSSRGSLNSMINSTQFHSLQQFQSLHGDKRTITVGYYAHSIEADTNSYANINVFGPPSPPTTAHYRTIGSLDASFFSIIAKFSPGSFFHDITLR